MLIQVLTNHIQNGEYYYTSKCAVALALRGMGFERVSVTREVIAVKKVDAVGCLWTRYKTPREVQKFIHRFDRQKTVKPITFILDEPINERNGG